MNVVQFVYDFLLISGKVHAYWDSKMGKPKPSSAEGFRWKWAKESRWSSWELRLGSI
jgi:hypothetical protein